MRRTISALLLSALSISAACASPERIAENARSHEQAAAIARSQGDWRRADSEQRAADKQWSKAHARATGVYGY
jgi:hypothetical protein